MILHITLSILLHYMFYGSHENQAAKGLQARQIINQNKSKHGNNYK